MPATWATKFAAWYGHGERKYAPSGPVPTATCASSHNVVYVTGT